MTTLSNITTAGLCAGTPTVQVLDNRGLNVRVLQFNRNTVGEVAVPRVIQQRYGLRGELLSSIDPRLFDEQQLDSTVMPNFRYQSSLTGQVLRTLSQDAGEEVCLFDIEQGICWRSNGRAQTWLSYDLLHRVTSTVEQLGTAPARISERYVYGESLPDAVLANSRGQLVRHYDTAGLSETSRFNTSAQPLQQVRQLLQDSLADSDWQGNEAQWQAQLDSERYLTRQDYDALGASLSSVDAKGNVQWHRHNVAGQLASTGLTLAGEAGERSILSAISYSAAGQMLREVAGNGVITDYTYEPQTQRLSRLLTTRPAQSGRDSLLQDLNSSYDPVGNILSISNAALSTRFHQNQRIEPANDYKYDALYQLLSASGRENASAGQQGPSLPMANVPISADPNHYSNYTRHYTYDLGGNLRQIQHQGRQGYTLDTVMSPSSNHGVRQTGHVLPDDVEGFFDACGNLQQLAPGQPLLWDGRNQLQQVTQVMRSGPDDDLERYQYDGGGARVRKTTVTQTSGTQRSAEVIYLPGLELRRTQRNTAGGSALEQELHVISVGGAGRQQVRVLHWEAGRPSDMPNDQLRGSLGNQIGSSVLELDQQANVLTLEEYFPYGGTAVWSGKTASETQYKFVRYSGKERDATGLYYYGFRYYAPWLGRWINPDPGGTVDGLNLYRMVRNNPIVFLDSDGLAPDTLVVFTQKEKKIENVTQVARVFFKQKEIKSRLIDDPIPYNEIAKRTAAITSYPDSMNLVLIGHGGYAGHLGMGDDYAYNLNKLGLPTQLTSKVGRIYIMNCFAGNSVKSIAEKTLAKGEGKWESLESVSGNLFYNTWSNPGAIILRQGINGAENSSQKGNWRGLAATALEREPGSGKTIDDLGLKTAKQFEARSILSPESFHRTYNVQSQTAALSYASSVRDPNYASLPAKAVDQPVAVDPEVPTPLAPVPVETARPVVHQVQIGFNPGPSRPVGTRQGGARGATSHSRSRRM
ncbi:RHS repeat-associated core domain-containing protein [Pseudomonas moorei]|uniref:RHS repeat-associated core domain-containing protein n=1 Tax=Pseudomonas moorei TaxID=395599 RepID=UPI00200C54BE|nr:RHS repeat-associated core domain-containing protein [Pseudomonas moorei]